MPLAIPSPRWPLIRATDGCFKILFGLDPKAKWPAAGMSNPDGSTKDVFVQGDWGKVQMWVDPLVGHPSSTGRLAHQHRLRCICPRCGQQMSAGRLQQHCNTTH